MKMMQGCFIAESQDDLKSLLDQGWTVSYNEYYDKGIRRIFFKKEVEEGTAYMDPVYTEERFTENIIESS